ncbi:MAG: PIG-L family deacetylase [Anaerolineae bacterium]|nr:PIG-L family deacetylase [Anaerolineae bacterium]MDQ7034854.1 PIG-L family deacetylase [Anaerolineae bacterium]
MNILAFGAHPDDIEAQCAGTLAKCAARGDKVTMCVVTDGRGRPKGDPDQMAAIRHQEAQESADVIGAELVWLAIPDGKLQVCDEHLHKFVETIRRAQPDIILTHPQDDYHPDHRYTYQLTLDAAQMARVRNYASDLPPFRGRTPIAFYDGVLGMSFIPEEWVDITDFFDAKIEMMSKHVSQMMPDTYDPNFVMPPKDENMFYRMLGLQSGYRGMQCGVRYAEAFIYWKSANRVVPYRILP